MSRLFKEIIGETIKTACQDYKGLLGDQIEMKGRIEKCYGTMKTNNIQNHKIGTDPSETSRMNMTCKLIFKKVFGK